MYLKEIRLHGFKSFADPTRLTLEPGVTAIVGPNGCGKSNIADAIRWVLGEKSAKSLRAGAMQDVIFQGTSGRKPVNLCEVSLIFTECEALLGTDHHEVEVSRRVVRDGGGEYYLNGKACRLKDIHNLFVDTGIGQVSYSFMLQGQIDQVLSSNPAERRAIFEEAAGISRYKAQRREALNKLAQVDANLARVTDVMEEVARQTASLKRQAAKALRYQRIHHRLSHLDRAHHGFRFGELQGELAAGKQRLQELEARAASLSAELEAAESGLSEKRKHAMELRQRMEADQAAVYEMRSEKENAVNRAEMAGLRREDQKARIQALREELSQLAAEEQALAEKLAGESRLKQEQMDLFGSSDEAFKQQSAELAELQKALNSVETEAARDKQALNQKEGLVSRLRSNCTHLELELKTFQVRHANLSEDLQTLENDYAVLQQDHQDLERARTARDEERERQEGHLAGLKERHAEQTRAFRDLQGSIQEAERKRASLQAQVEMLEDLQAKFEGFSEGARALLQGRLPEIVDPSDITPFLECLKVREGATHMVELLLGAATEGVFLKRPEGLARLARALREEGIGRAPVLSPTLARPDNPAPGSLPALLKPASELVSATQPEIQNFLESYLEGCWVSQDLEGFLDYAGAHPDFRFHFVVTPEGELLDSRGLLMAGRSTDGREDSSFLARRNQLESLRKSKVQLEDRIERFRLESSQIQGRLETGEKRIEEQQGLLGEIRTELTTLAAQIESSLRNQKTNRNTAEIRRKDRQQLESSKDQSTAKLTQARAELEQTEQEMDTLRGRLAESESRTAALREQRESLREQFDEVRFDIARKRQRLELLDRGLHELQAKSRETAQSRIRRMEEAEQLESQVESLGAEIQLHEQSARNLDRQLGEKIGQLDSDRARLRELEQAIASVENGLAPRRETQRALSAEVNREEVAIARKESRIQFITEECQRLYNTDPASLDWRRELWQAGESLPERIRVDIEETSPDELETLQERPEPTAGDLEALDPVDWSALESEVESLRTRLQSMGPVNLVAIEEYRDLKERHAFLKEQSDDLWKAKEELLQAIDEINSTSQALFADTFAKIRENFHYTFETLFGGGKADLALIDNEDVLESGIEITAQPPGTRLRNLALLSGGQKTMTAVALLFAIYMVKPSPFCVLDEIDAPLDDANIGRFTGMLEGFLRYSQFLIITHNKRTISVADTIYGATMQERGVSRMISMRFNKATGRAEASPGGEG